jgi:hypothetical protein
MTEYERLVQDRRDADRARNNDWKARALKAEEDNEKLEIAYKVAVERIDELSAARLKAEAALREIEAIWFNAEGLETNDFYQIGKIARAALEGE